MSTYIELINKIFNGVNPYDGFPRGLYAVDMQGWRSEHTYLDNALNSVKPTIVVEVGAWKGASSIYMGKILRSINPDSVILSVDTWLGSSEHFINNELRADIAQLFGMRPLYTKFINNVIENSMNDTIIPISLDSLNAAALLKSLNIRPQVIHIDAGHDYDSVYGDLSAWWPLLSPGGVLIGDDYDPIGKSFPGVCQAFDDFFGKLNLCPIDFQDGKCQILKYDRHDFPFHLQLVVPPDEKDEFKPSGKIKLDKKLALSCIVKNEAHSISRMIMSALPLIDFCVIVDTGSTDNTIEIADMLLRNSGIAYKIFSETFEDFASARNTSIEHVPEDIEWILALDADEHLVPRDYDKFNSLLDSNVDAWRLPRYNFSDGDKIAPPTPYPDAQGRLFRNYNDRRIKFAGKVHEILTGWSRIRRVPINSYSINGNEGGPHIHHMGCAYKTPNVRREREELYKKLAET